jgi:hypothetical protein
MCGCYCVQCDAWEDIFVFASLSLCNAAPALPLPACELVRATPLPLMQAMPSLFQAFS